MLLEFPYSRYFHFHPQRIVETTLADGTAELVARFGGGAWGTGVQFQVVIAAAVAIIGLLGLVPTLRARMERDAWRRGQGTRVHLE